MTLQAERVSWTRGGTLVVDEVSLRPREGEMIGLLGPNGSGKSSLLRLLQAVSRPDSGMVSLDGEDIGTVGRRAVARRIAAVTQHADTDTDITVHDVVRLGRTPHRSFWGLGTGDDDRVIRECLDRVELGDKADRMWTSLSGGERQRAHIARALAQEPRELLLDEPTNHLDIRHQLELLDLVSGLEVTSIIALHDLNLAALFCDSVVVLRSGRAVAAGPPATVLTRDLINEVYEVDAEVVPDPATGRVRISFIVPGRAQVLPLRSAATG